MFTNYDKELPHNFDFSVRNRLNHFTAICEQKWLSDMFGDSLVSSFPWPLVTGQCLPTNNLQGNLSTVNSQVFFMMTLICMMTIVRVLFKLNSLL